MNEKQSLDVMCGQQHGAHCSAKSMYLGTTVQEYRRDRRAILGNPVCHYEHRCASISSLCSYCHVWVETLRLANPPAEGLYQTYINKIQKKKKQSFDGNYVCLSLSTYNNGRLCALVVKVPGYISRGPG
jgi:hypothetical protein